MMSLKRKFFIRFEKLNWKLLLLFMVSLFYIGILIISTTDAMSPIHYGGDYLAFWSVGKIADEQGYSKIYDLDLLRSVQSRELLALGFSAGNGESSFVTIPAPFLSFFMIPFQFFSKIGLEPSYWLWNLINLIILIGYMAISLWKHAQKNSTSFSDLSLLILALLSFPVFDNMLNGQLNIFMLVCAGEFLRNAIDKKPVISGIWLAGLLLKPQLLVLILPWLLITRNGKVILGFISSSGIIMAISFLLSGITGTKALINIWTKYSTGMASNSLEAMINWRMIGVNLNNLLNMSLGWVVTGIGIVLSILVVYFVVKHNPRFGTPTWLMSMLGVFSATLTVTWHSHYHMALVLIPFLLYTVLHGLFPEKVLYLWVVITPIAWMASAVVSQLFQYSTNTEITINPSIVIALSGFILNLFVLISTYRMVLDNQVHSKPSTPF